MLTYYCMIIYDILLEISICVSIRAGESFLFFWNLHGFGVGLLCERCQIGKSDG